jgi:D-alanyl-D-alanine carboxypeptidase
MALPARLGGPADATYEIEIGTFASAEEAEARLAAVQSKTASVAGHAPMALPVEHGGRQAYRARFAGFDEHKAAGTCLELRRAAIDCQVAAP